MSSWGGGSLSSVVKEVTVGMKLSGSGAKGAGLVFDAGNNVCVLLIEGSVDVVGMIGEEVVGMTGGGRGLTIEEPARVTGVCV